MGPWNWVLYPEDEQPLENFCLYDPTYSIGVLFGDDSLIEVGDPLSERPFEYVSLCYDLEDTPRDALRKYLSRPVVSYSVAKRPWRSDDSQKGYVIAALFERCIAFVELKLSDEEKWYFELVREVALPCLQKLASGRVIQGNTALLAITHQEVIRDLSNRGLAHMIFKTEVLDDCRVFRGHNEASVLVSYVSLSSSTLQPCLLSLFSFHPLSLL